MILKNYIQFINENKEFDGYINGEVALSLMPGESLVHTTYSTRDPWSMDSTRNTNFKEEKYEEPIVFIMLNDEKTSMLVLDMMCQEDMSVKEILENPKDLLDYKSDLFKKYKYCINWMLFDNFEFDDRGFYYPYTKQGDRTKNYFKFRDPNKNDKNDLMKSLSGIHKYDL